MHKYILPIALLTTMVLGMNGQGIRAQETKPANGANGAAAAIKPDADGWKNLFDGKSLTGWKTTGFARGAKAHLEPKFRGDDAAITAWMQAAR